MSFNKLGLGVFATIMLTVGSGWSADNELYDAPPPEGATFLRWIDPGLSPEVFGIAGLGVDGDVFHPISAALTDGAQPGAFYTAAKGSDGHLVIVQEPPRADRSKVSLTLINLTGAPVRLVLHDQMVEVIPPTAANAAGARAVNPVAAELTVMTASDTPLGTFDVQLRRGQNVTFIARPEGAALIENRFGPNLEG